MTTPLLLPPTYQFRTGTTEERLDTLVEWFERNPGSGRAVKQLFWDLDLDGSGDIDRGEVNAGECVKFY